MGKVFKLERSDQCTDGNSSQVERSSSRENFGKFLDLDRGPGYEPHVPLGVLLVDEKAGNYPLLNSLFG